ncbi:19782_t:CDS:2, partial [Racocetra persica]
GGVGEFLYSQGYGKNSRTLVISIAILQGLLFSLDGFVTALLKSPFNQMCYAINKSEGIPYKKKRNIITLATRSNEHCKETLKKMGMLTIVNEMIRIFIMGKGIIDKDLEPYELHIGGARTALFNYLFAKQNDGQFILRVEDTDLQRNKEIFVNNLYEDLLWLGLKPDESIFQIGEYGPYRQTQRLD